MDSKEKVKKILENHFDVLANYTATTPKTDSELYELSEAIYQIAKIILNKKKTIERRDKGTAV